jgi:hypothetical protein
VREKDGSNESMIRVWGGSASTLHDVPATFATKQPWEAAGKHRLVDHDYFRSTIYLNAEQKCTMTIDLKDYW